MPGLLNHSPAVIIQRLFISKSLGADPPDTPWPVFATREPGDPDNVITIFSTDGVGHGRTHIDGEKQVHHGIQVRIRAKTDEVGFLKANTLAVAMDEDIYQETITISGISYLIHAFTRTTEVISMGKETPTSQRSVFTINAIVSLRML